MNEREKLQKAIEITISAGYQLNQEAFAFLRALSATGDPMVIMEAVVQKIEELPEKPFFIDRGFLETILEEPEDTRQTYQPEREQHSTAESQEGLIERTENIAPEGALCFHPYAKDVESQINILEDPTDKLTSNGTIEDYLQYFQDRFKRIERLLRQRIDVKAATSISEALKSQAKMRLKIICMITEKREVRRQTILSVEDLQASTTILVSNKASEDLRKKTLSLIQDQVVCMAVVKTRSDLFLAEDIIFPEVVQKPRLRSPEPVYAVLTSDIHVGSNKFNKEAFKKFVFWLKGKYGNDKMIELASHVKYLLVAGDIVDGVGIYPNQEQELVIRDVNSQYKYAAKLIERIPEYIEVIITPGNHDSPRKALPMPAIPKESFGNLLSSKNVHSLGDPSVISIHNIEVLMYHGRSLDDVISAVPGLSYNQPEKAMKLQLQGRHLAPLYGGKTLLSPENRDFLVIDQVPDIFHSGHVHVTGLCNHRGVLVANSGAWQDQTEYMQKMGVFPTPGKVPVINLQTLETTVLSFV
jgi:DNA polymerase II small subunit